MVTLFHLWFSTAGRVHDPAKASSRLPLVEAWFSHCRTCDTVTHLGNGPGAEPLAAAPCPVCQPGAAAILDLADYLPHDYAQELAPCHHL